MPPPSLPEVFRSIAVPRGARFWGKLAAFAGPGYLVAVGYMDPGNWATDIAGGSRFGYALLWVIVLSNFVAIFLQWLALRLGIAGGRDLAQLCRERFNRPTALLLWATAEVAIVACDLAEVIGTAIALQLLFHLPLLIGVAVTALDTLLILALQSRGFRYIEALVIALLVVIGGCFAIEIGLARPGFGAMATGLVPSGAIIRDPAMLYIALGIFGATVMPHNLYLHSAIAQTRRFHRSDIGKREAIRFSTLDCVIALGLALLINAAILILAAASFHTSGHAEVAEIQDAYRLLSPLLGAGFASTLFALALLASGQNSTLTGTLAGQVVMEGFLRVKTAPWLRRLITRAAAIVPAAAVIGLMGEGAATRLLILSQVVLSLQLGFAVLPLVMFTSDKAVMGAFANTRAVVVAGYALTAAIVAVNLWLVVRAVTG